MIRLKTKADDIFDNVTEFINNRDSGSISNAENLLKVLRYHSQMLFDAIINDGSDIQDSINEYFTMIVAQVRNFDTKAKYKKGDSTTVLQYQLWLNFLQNFIEIFTEHNRDAKFFIIGSPDLLSYANNLFDCGKDGIKTNDSLSNAQGMDGNNPERDSIPISQVSFSAFADKNKAICSLLERLKDEGYIISNGDGYKLNKGKRGINQLIAYWVEKVSYNFKLSSRQINGKKDVRWKPFEEFFGLKEGTLKRAKQNFIKSGKDFKPNGWESIDDFTSTDSEWKKYG